MKDEPFSPYSCYSKFSTAYGECVYILFIMLLCENRNHTEPVTLTSMHGHIFGFSGDNTFNIKFTISISLNL